MANRVEKEYATALFELNPQDEVVEKNLAQLIEINKELLQNEELVKFIKHPKINKEDKKDLFKKAFVNFTILDFIYVLIDNDRLLSLQGIIEEYEVLYYKAKHIMPIEVVTAVELNQKMQNEIVKALEGKFTEKIKVRFSINTEIIGGVILKYNGQVLDNSCLGALASLRDFIRN